MRRINTPLMVEQQIVYADTGEIDRFNQQTTAVLLELTSFFSLTYQDQEGQSVCVKVADDPAKEGWQVEIKRPDYVLRFNPDAPTATFYQTPQGLWELSVVTQRIDWQFEPGETPHTTKKTLLIDYQLKKAQELLGNYRFRLIYTS